MQEIVNLLNVVSVDVQCVSGSVSKNRETHDEAFTEGSVRYMDPKLLRPFAKARQAATRLCRTHGTRFLSGWGIPDESLDEVRKGLRAISKDVAQEKADLMANLYSHRRKWENAHPEIMEFQSKFFTDKEIEESIQMLVGWYKITPLQLNDPGMNDAIQAELQGMVGKVLTEIAQDVRDSWSTDAKQATTRSIGVLQRVQTKLQRLTFLGGELADVAGMIESVTRILPSHGKIQGADFVILSGLMNTLSDPSKVLATSRIVASESPAGLWAVDLHGNAGASEQLVEASEPTGGLLDGLLSGGDGSATVEKAEALESAAGAATGDLLAGLLAAGGIQGPEAGVSQSEGSPSEGDRALEAVASEAEAATESLPQTHEALSPAQLATKGRSLSSKLGRRSDGASKVATPAPPVVHVPVSRAAEASSFGW